MAEPSMGHAAGQARDALRDTPKDIKRATAKTQDQLQDDVEALQDHIKKLSEQIAGVLGSKGEAVYRAARAGVDSVMSDVGEKGQEAREAFGEVADNFTDAIDESIAKRPYTTLAIAVGLGFLFGATWRR